MTTGETKFDPYATHHLINEDTSYIPVNLRKNAGNPGGRLEPYDSESTHLQELSLIHNTYFGPIHYEIHLDMKLDDTIDRIFQEMSIFELETLHHPSTMRIRKNTNSTVTLISSTQKTIRRIFVIRK